MNYNIKRTLVAVPAAIALGLGGAACGASEENDFGIKELIARGFTEPQRVRSNSLSHTAGFGACRLHFIVGNDGGVAIVGLGDGGSGHISDQQANAAWLEENPVHHSDPDNDGDVDYDLSSCIGDGTASLSPTGEPTEK
jgi:hypothetical protein